MGVKLSRLLDQFESEVLKDCPDDLTGGVSWWSATLNPDQIGLLTTYLTSLIHGLGDSLDEAMFAIDQYSISSNTWNNTLRRLVSLPHNAEVPAIRLAHDDPLLPRHVKLMTAFSDLAISNLYTAMDRLGGLVLLASGWERKNSIQHAAWSQCVEAAKKITPPNASLNSPGFAVRTDGDVSGALVQLAQAINDVDSHGPEGWLDWLRDTRNTRHHRAAAIKHRVQARTDKGTFYYHNVFFKDPTRFYLQQFAERDVALREKRKGPLEPLLLRDPRQVMRGLHDSVDSLAVALMVEVIGLWKARRRAPDAIAQPLNHWRDISSRGKNSFQGYGEPMTVDVSAIALSPRDVNGFRVARALDSEH